MSLKSLLLIAAVLYSTQSLDICSQYNCFDFTNNWPAAPSIQWNYCAMATSMVRTNSTMTTKWREFAMKSCVATGDNADLYTCPVGSLKSAAQLTTCKNNKAAPAPTTNLIPGYNCTANDQCISGVCNADKRCQGSQSSSFFDPCTSDIKCDVGYSCQNARCLPLKALGETCTLANECVPYATCATGICRKYFSVDVGEELGSVTTDPRACKSVEYSPTDKVCELETTRQIIGAVGEVAATEVCRYKDNEGGLDGKKKDSVCGYAPSPSAFCPLGHGEKQFTDVRDLAQKVVDAMPTMCHISEALSCPNLVEMYPRETYAFAMIPTFDKVYPMMEGNDQCVKYNMNYKNWWLLTGQYPAPQ